VWSNWSGEMACRPAVLARPASTADVVAEVERAAAAGRTVRAIGAGHSFSDVAATDGTMLSLERMDRVLDADPATGLVRVQAGIRLHQLSDRLAALGLAVENLGDVNVQALAGAVVTGTHGTGARLPNIAARVEAVQLVAGDGTVRELDGGDALRAARVSVGALGVITELTLRCVPAYVLRGVDEPRPLDEVLAALDELACGARHFEFFVFPHTDIALTRTNEIVDLAPAPPGAARRWVEDVLVANHGLALACAAARRMPRAIPRITQAIARAFSPRVRVDRSDRIFASPRLVRFTEMELAFPRAAAAEVIPQIKVALERHPVVFPMEVRFVAADDALLSPSAGRDSVYVAVHNAVGMPWELPFRAVHAIGEAHGARPHWGKRHFHTAETLRPRYPGWDRFAAVRAELDPDGRFANDHIRRVLGA
jgi:L-gulonolactone oxidase